jgi:hypothetical protein
MGGAPEFLAKCHALTPAWPPVFLLTLLLLLLLP